MIRAALIIVASLAFITSAQTADKPKEGPADLERKLHGEWKGGACEGDWTIAPDGDNWRRVVPSPRPVEIPDLRVLKLLLDQGVVVV